MPVARPLPLGLGQLNDGLAGVVVGVLVVVAVVILVVVVVVVVVTALHWSAPPSEVLPAPHGTQTQTPLIDEDAIPGAHVHALMAGAVVHVRQEQRHALACMHEGPLADVARRQVGQEGQQTDVHS